MIWAAIVAFLIGGMFGMLICIMPDSFDPKREDKPMKFLIKKVSDNNFKEKREINTMQDLKELEKIHPGWQGEDRWKDFIVSFGDAEHPAEITIYDDYIE